MITSATLRVDDTKVMSPTCLTNTALDINKNLQGLTSVIKLRCSNPETFDMTIEEPAINYIEKTSEADMNQDKKVGIIDPYRQLFLGKIVITVKPRKFEVVGTRDFYLIYE